MSAPLSEPTCSQSRRIGKGLEPASRLYKELLPSLLFTVWTPYQPGHKPRGGGAKGRGKAKGRKK